MEDYVLKLEKDLARQPLIEQIENQQKEIEQLREEIRMLKQYAEISKNDKQHRKKILNEYIEINQKLTDRILELELNG